MGNRQQTQALSFYFQMHQKEEAFLLLLRLAKKSVYRKHEKSKKQLQIF